MAKTIRFPIKVIEITFRTIGMLFCLFYVAVNTTKNKKQAPKRTFAQLDIECMQLPELGKKLQQSFK